MEFENWHEALQYLDEAFGDDKVPSEAEQPCLSEFCRHCQMRPFYQEWDERVRRFLARYKAEKAQYEKKVEKSFGKKIAELRKK